MKLIILISLIVTLPMLSLPQNTSDYELTFEVNRVFAPLSISVGTLHNAQTIEDLNPYYKSTWVKEFNSVEVTSIIDGKTTKAYNENDKLTIEQKRNMKQADFGSNISIVISYLPDNTLKHNDLKVYDFTFVVNPENTASYPGTTSDMLQFISDHTVDKIPEKNFDKFNVMAIQFTIDENGRVIEAHVPAAVDYVSTQDRDASDLLIKTVCKMPRWTPASYSDGTKVKQDFVLTAGDHRSCTLNLLNVRRKSLLASIEE